MKFAVIGHPVGHSLSPAMHEASFRAIGFAGSYGAVDVAPEELPEAMKRFVAEGYRGINCTIPHKEAVMPLMDALDASAVTCGAVNTVRIEENGRTTGFNTDCVGFALSLEEACPSFRWQGEALMLGAGGAARAVAVACLEKGCTSLTIANRTRAKAEVLAEALREHYATPIVAIGLDELRAADFSLIINTTAIGLKAEDASALPAAYFRPGQVVCDIIPVKRETATLFVARQAGAIGVGGLGMLIHQGAEAFRIWTGQEPDVAAMTAAIS